ncbi:damage-control phosphatase ARMT1-like isoform X2 [Harmonia axyridis]|uniref:damage-control phosphatase ARMT1-like isoform X2 n=1 Tax=Harmonia axyridis TaxID=115357 RepID=UPI001E27554D|nr:damage-control phosphatase ARMT1-like isoform X2 [Harmonia axyridis]
MNLLNNMPVREELKKIVDELAALKYELQSNRELTPIVSNDPDAEIFNDFLQKRKVEDGHTSPYSTTIMFAESYLYRRLRMVFEKKKILKDYDFFKKIKEDAFEEATPIMRELAIHMEEGCECISDKDAIFDLMKITLWANKYDLAVNKGVEHGVHLNMARKLEPNVVCDHSEAIWEAFHSNQDNDSIAYVLDNAGYELFCDLCLSDMLITKGLTSHVTFHAKAMPCYVSDVTLNDVNWMIQTLKKHIDPHLRCLGQRWDDYVANKTWEFHDNPFWHYPLDYTHMQAYAPELHNQLASANLIIFKGDLNYRKLFGDINWDPNTPVDQGLRGFLPAKLCVLRTVKFGVVCGIPDEVADKCMKADVNWKESGNYGVIQYCDTIYVEPQLEEMVFPPDPGAEGTAGAGATREAEEGDGDEEGPSPEVEGAGDLGQAEEAGGGEASRGDDIARVVAGMVGHTAQEVDNEWGEENPPDSFQEATGGAGGSGGPSSIKDGKGKAEQGEQSKSTDREQNKLDSGSDAFSKDDVGSSKTEASAPEGAEIGVLMADSQKNNDNRPITTTLTGVVLAAEREQKVREPGSPSEVSVDHSPEVDGDEVPE